jgi:hypothetical protein
MNKYKQENKEGQEFVIFNLLKSNKKLKALDVLLYQQIVYTSAFTGYSPKTNKYFIEFFNDTEWNIRKSIELLIEEGLITRTITSNTDRKLYPVKLDFSKEEPMSDTQGGMSVPQGGMSVPQGGMSDTQGGMSDTQGGMSVPHTYNNIKIQLDNIKNKNNNNINITENLDLVEGIDKEVKSLVSNTSTNIPTGGDNIYSEEIEDYLNSLIRIEVEETLEEKIEKVKTKSSIKEEEFDIPQRNIEDKFSDYEIYNALNY